MVKRNGSWSFREMLANRQKKVDSLVCVGLDPLVDKLPIHICQKMWARPDWEHIVEWLCRIIDTTAPFTAMYKPQKAHYEAIIDGDKILKKIVGYIHKYYPDIPVFLDCKRGDIDRTQDRYRVAHFEIDGIDGMNFSPYMGKSCMEPLFDIKNPGRAIVGLCYTSNPEAREIQDLRIGDEYLYEVIARKIWQWADDIGVYDNAGLVMAAAHKKDGSIFSEHLQRVRDIVCDDLWFLIPGVGTQEGFIRETIKSAFVKPGSIAINSSSAIIFASSNEGFAEAAGIEAKKMRDEIRETGGSCS